ncbi:MAG: aminotransferase class I/II-fold pyridoxal phosphate-dependent enzyme [Alloprevotella sp.]
MTDIIKLARPCVARLQRRCDNQGEERPKEQDSISLDGGINPFNAPYNVLPSADDIAEVEEQAARALGINPDYLCLTCGGEAGFDLLLRTFCNPSHDNVIVAAQSAENYRHSAEINDVEVREVSLGADLKPDFNTFRQTIGPHTKLVVVGAPAFPVGTMPSVEFIRRMAESFEGLTVLDTTFATLKDQTELTRLIQSLPHLVVMGSFAVNLASAALQLHYLIGRREVIDCLRVVTPAHHLPKPVIDETKRLLTAHRFDADKWQTWISGEKVKVMAAIAHLPYCKGVVPSSANFFMMKVDKAEALLDFLRSEGIIVKDCRHLPLCSDCIAVTIGRKEDNNRLLSALRRFT